MRKKSFLVSLLVFSAGFAQSSVLDLGLLGVFGLGLVSGINPCLFAILAFISAYALSLNKGRRKVLKITISFSLAVFITYLLIGAGLASIPQSLTPLFNYGMIIFLFIIGFWFVKDYNKESSKLFKTPKWLKNVINKLTYNDSVFSSFTLGVIFSLYKVPCVGGVYVAILSLMSTNLAYFFYMLAFNLGIVLPLFIISSLICFGVSPSSVDRFRKQKRGLIRFITGLTMIVLAVLLLAGVL